jgi:serine/threonine protein phosphatase PrpC
MVAALACPQLRTENTIEQLADPTARTGFVVGSEETPDVFEVDTAIANGALHTSRGVRYKTWNEDGGFLASDRSGRIYAGVFDQAGGMGSHGHGHASGLAAAELLRSLRSIAPMREAGIMAEAAMKIAGMTAHRLLLMRDRNEATTMLGAFVDEDRAVIVSTGDSQALHFDKAGALKGSTKPHRLPPPLPQNVIIAALGQSDGDPMQDTYNWKLTRGDLLVLGTDGLMDAGLSRAHIGRLVSQSPTAAIATRALRNEVYARMDDRRAKPDNVTIVVLRV